MAEPKVKEVAGDVVESTPIVQEKVSKDVPEWKGYTAIASLVVGILSFCASFVPCCGCIMSIIGIVCGVLGLPSNRKTLAIVGIVLSALALLISTGFFIFNLVTGLANNSYDWSFDTNW